MRQSHRLIATTTVAVVAGLLGLVAASFATAATAGTPTYTWSSRPSPVVLRPPTGTVRLRAVSFCWSGPPQATDVAELCSSGTPTTTPRTVQTSQALPFWFGMPRWRFVATLVPDRGGRPVATSAVRTTSRTFRIARPTRAGLYDVVLFGRGPLGTAKGDIAVTFQWRVRRS